jgi:hypothetical protein
MAYKPIQLSSQNDGLVGSSTPKTAMKTVKSGELNGPIELAAVATSEEK